jgi:hypothetical protein
VQPPPGPSTHLGSRQGLRCSQTIARQCRGACGSTHLRTSWLGQSARRNEVAGVCVWGGGLKQGTHLSS